MKSSPVIIRSSWWMAALFRRRFASALRPRPQHRVLRHRGDALTRHAQELALLQVADRILHAALRQAGALRDPSERESGLAVQRPSPHEEINEEGGRRAVMSDQSPH